MKRVKEFIIGGAHEVGYLAGLGFGFTVKALVELFFAVIQLAALVAFPALCGVTLYLIFRR